MPGRVEGGLVVTVDDVRALALTLPRTTEHLIHDRVKFRVGAIVYVAFSRDETTMGFGYPKEERDALVEAADVGHLPAERGRNGRRLGVRPQQVTLGAVEVLAHPDRLRHG